MKRPTLDNASKITVDGEANDIQARLLVARDMERHVRSSATKRKTKVGFEKKRSLTMQEGCDVLSSLIQQMRSSRQLFKKSAEKVGSSDASCNALQDQRRKVQGNL